MRDWFRRLMMGRYGVDQLTWVLLVLSLLLSLCGSIFRVVCYLRIFSRNIYARQLENQRFMQFWWKLKNGRSKRPSREQRKNYKVFSCPTCKQKLRVPRGKGKISISCPKCGRSFIKKT